MGLNLPLRTPHKTAPGAHGKKIAEAGPVTLVSGKRDAHRRLHVYPAFPIKIFFPVFFGGKQRPSRKWLSD